MGEADFFYFTCLNLNMRKKDALGCSFESWYPNFRHLTIKSQLIPLDDATFVSYLVGEGESTLRLPSSNDDAKAKEKDEFSSDEENWGDGNEEMEATDRNCPSFPLVENQIRSAIKLLGGEVFPKLNWSAPRDAAWISCDKTLKCRSVDDVLLLIKSSDFALRDLTQPFLHCEDAAEVDETVDQLFLVLRQWRNDIVPNSEFRCFIKNGELVAFCQRHDDAFFPFIAANEAEIRRDIQDFFQRNVKGKFHQDNYVMDVFRKSRGEVLLLDFGPWGRVTDSLMFDWTELNELSSAVENNSSSSTSSNATESTPVSLSASTSSDEVALASIASSTPLPIFRYVISDADMRPTRFASSAVPLDFNHLSSGEDPQKLFDFLNLQKLQNGELDDDDDD